MQTKAIHIQKDRFKQFGLVLVSFAFVYTGYLMITGLFESSRYSALSSLIYGYAAMIFFGVVGLTILFNLFTSKPALIIDKDGIVNNAHVGGGYIINWSNIESMKIISINKQRMISIDIRNDQEIYRQVNFFSEKWMRLNRRFFGTPTFIPAAMLSLELEEVLSIIRQQKKLHSKRSRNEFDEENQSGMDDL